MRPPLKWHEKAAFFRVYRRLGRLQPAAQRCHIARMTARKVLAELETIGFSRRPRLAALDHEELSALQLAHLQKVAVRLAEMPLVLPPVPAECAYGEVDEIDLLQRKLPQPPSTQDELGLEIAWHVKEQPAEASVMRFLEETAAYRRACLELFYGLMDDVAEATGLPVLGEDHPGEALSEQAPDKGRVWLSAVGSFYASLFAGRSLNPDHWEVKDEGVSHGREWSALVQGTAVGLLAGPTDAVLQAHERLSQFFAQGTAGLRREARTLELRRQDLETLAELVEAKLHAVAAEGEVPGICRPVPTQKGRGSSSQATPA